ncbi:MAG: hypothetical protein OEY14_09835 [Myxococcales bacterium]|nr:hypothetical protein [Myxococcales bacterium]
MRLSAHPIPSLLLVCASLLAGCGSDEGVDSAAAAEAAYRGLDGAIAKSIQLGFDGFNTASSANIDPQTAMGDVSGELTVSGQVDAGASANKEMRLRLALTNDYEDTVAGSDLQISYTTDPDGATDPLLLPALTLSLRAIPSSTTDPNGTLTGTLIGDVDMMGDVQGIVTLNLTIAGEIQVDPADGVSIIRVPDTTTITGTAISNHGTFDVDVTI